MTNTFGLLFSGFSVKLYAVGAALYTGNLAVEFIANAFGAVAKLPL